MFPFLSHTRLGTTGTKETRDKSVEPGLFIIRHYAGDVAYKADGFMAKNADTLYKDLSRAMFKSTNAVLREVHPWRCRQWLGCYYWPPNSEAQTFKK